MEVRREGTLGGWYFNLMGGGGGNLFMYPHHRLEVLGRPELGHAFFNDPPPHCHKYSLRPTK